MPAFSNDDKPGFLKGFYSALVVNAWKFGYIPLSRDFDHTSGFIPIQDFDSFQIGLNSIFYIF